MSCSNNLAYSSFTSRFAVSKMPPSGTRRAQAVDSHRRCRGEVVEMGLVPLRIGVGHSEVENLLRCDKLLGIRYVRQPDDQLELRPLLGPERDALVPSQWFGRRLAPILFVEFRFDCLDPLSLLIQTEPLEDREIRERRQHLVLESLNDKAHRPEFVVDPIPGIRHSLRYIELGSRRGPSAFGTAPSAGAGGVDTCEGGLSSIRDRRPCLSRIA